MSHINIDRKAPEGVSLLKTIMCLNFIQHMAIQAILLSHGLPKQGYTWKNNEERISLSNDGNQVTYLPGEVLLIQITTPNCTAKAFAEIVDFLTDVANRHNLNLYRDDNIWLIYLGKKQ